ncbi:hypothetical protein A3K34_01240 [candidate division WWE3 bacterium RIFOXYC1_FULL_40_10]|uniref:Uncharacterized protein n=1 Tax=candidate division WWE3 bacterium RIFOXYA2_FULL_46_9 TaxID=1802636 RepID=A0A1F4W1Y6_UNCKA|nr:MAG: hypothetical protein A3K58_01240 [candidate division WWE3 bacterium RIFOXYB1_FULL_40_22]OGC61494.1 MAG: hypothetical protein A3K37_01240 [candidate division WWE3 bacterium RIFOXYA1_FULL_40_11]OGC63426.1 MAG: hypothetical protein A2264_01720 [candidate division WWE3 bacterium RIFOXYA2_FULL_46_9]OGC64544.1 MAG: hypothetical protein A2326_03525 [candidate division WWE3 bacterium RIFOXYB2_FULL_41_6]OGC65877.1 MAG: hypothetical protein A3K34_01240 [candidate division WWE3 bacterium RIFOXYC1_
MPDQIALLHAKKRRVIFFGIFTLLILLILVTFCLYSNVNFNIKLKSGLLGLFNPSVLDNHFKNKQIVKEVEAISDDLLKNLDKFNGLPSNSKLQSILTSSKIFTCLPANDTEDKLICFLESKKFHLPQTCDTSLYRGGAREDILGPCYIYVYSTGDLEGDDLGAGRFRLITKLWPVQYDDRDQAVPRIYIFDSQKGSYICPASSIDIDTDINCSKLGD